MSSLVLAGSLPAPHWTVATSVDSDDGYADLKWGMSGDTPASFFRLTERHGGQTSTHFVDHPTTRLFRIEPGVYEFWVQACQRDAAGYPDCGAMSPRLELTVLDEVGDRQLKPSKKGNGRGDDSPGPGGFSPGRWHNPDREGHGWTFFWRNGLSYPDSHPWFGDAWSLFGSWYTYEVRSDDPINEPLCPNGAADDHCEYRPAYAQLLFNHIGSQQAVGTIYVRRDGDNVNIGSVTVEFDGAGNATIDWNASFLYESLQAVEGIEMLVSPDPDPADNPSHYSGYWYQPGQDWFVSHALGQYSESVEVLFDDQHGNASWIMAAPGAPMAGLTSLCFFYIESGYAPSGSGSIDFFEGNCDHTQDATVLNRNGAREFTGFESERFWVRMPLPGGSAPSGIFKGTQSFPEVLEKGVHFHRISYDSPAGANCDAGTDPGGCSVELTWSTDGDFPLTSAFAHETGSGQREPIATVPVMESGAWTPDSAGEYEFELRMGDTPDSTLMAVSSTFTVFGDPEPPGDGDPPPGDGDPETPPAPGEPPNMTPTVASSQTGATRGEFSVTPLGSGSYRVPILVAPGSGGLSPSVSLVYDSQAGNGPLGVGWQLDGFSVISRCAQTLEQDVHPEVQRITFTAEDRFCLDGERLMAVDGAYGAHGTEYRKEIDDYTRVVSYGGGSDGPAYFKAWSKSGVVAEFGRTGDSRIETRAPGSQGVAYAWAQNRIEDTTGNYLLFAYAEAPTGPVDFVLDKIRYTGNTGAGTDPYAELRFIYAQGREDDGLSYISGVGATHSRLLTRVDSLSRISAGSPLEYLRAYHLEYGIDGWGRKALETLTECRDSSANLCFQPTEFAWLKSEHAVSAAGPQASHLFTDDFRGLALGDANGDGRADLLITERDGDGFEFGIATGSPSGQFNMGGQRYAVPEDEDNGRPVALTVIDLNADGFQDVIYLRESISGTNWYARMAGPGGMGNEFLLLANCCNTISPSLLQVMDYNGDGLSDVMTSRPLPIFEEASELIVLINNFEPGDAQPSFRQPLVVQVNYPDLFPAFTSTGWQLGDEVPSIGFQTGRSMPGRVDDFYGDGSADILVKLSRLYRRCASPPCPPDGPEAPEPPEHNAFDFNASGGTTAREGPGGPDPAEQWGQATFYLVLFADENGEYSSYEVIGKGAEAACDVPDVCNIHHDLPDLKQTRPADINADGLADVAYLDAFDRWFYRLNTGTEFLQPQLIGELGEGEVAEHARLVDINGDRYPELIYPSDVEQDGAMWMVLFNHLGQGFSTPQTSAMPAGNSLHGDFEIMLDFTSDGIIDQLVIDMRADGQGAQSHSTRLRRGVNLLTGQSNQAANVITGIENGFGAQTEISFKPLTDSSVHSRMNNSANTHWGNGSVVYDLSVPYYVVSSVANSAPTFANPNAMAERHYYYVGAKIQAGGRGFLGFAEVVEWDAQNRLRINTRYRQDFPFTGLVGDSSIFVTSQLHNIDIITDISSENPVKWPSVQATTPAAGGSMFATLLRYEIHEYNFIQTAAGGGAFAVRTSDELTREYSLQGQFKGKALTTRDFDNWGNVVTGVERNFAVDGKQPWSQVTTSNEWNNDTTKWRLGRLDAAEVTHWRTGSGSITRSSSYDYHPVSDLLIRETAEPGHPVHQVVTEHSLDAFGNRAATAVTGIGMATRSSSSTFDPLGRFAVATRNAYGQVTKSMEAWDAFGTALETANIDGVFSTTAVDLMGRPFVTYVETGAWQKTLMGTGSHTRCPSGTAYHSVMTGGGTATSIECRDRLGRKIRNATEGFLGSWINTDTYYDSSGRPERVSEPYYHGDSRFWNTTDYDALGRVARVTAANGLVEDTWYDQQAYHCGSSGARATLKRTQAGDGAVREHWERKNPAGETEAVLDDHCGEIGYAYDAVGNLVQTDGIDGSIISIAYDPLGLNKVQMNDPDKGVWQYASNALGEVTRQLDGKQQAIDFDYDVLGRVIERRELRNVDSLGDSFVDVVHSETRTWQNSTAPGITGRGQVLAESYRQGVSGTLLHQREYQHDAFGRVVQVDHQLEGELFTERTTYDAHGRVFQRFDASGDDHGIRFVYNDRGYMEKIKEARDGAEGVVYQHVQAMDARGNAIAVTLGNQVEAFADYDPASGFVRTLEAYDADGQEMQFVEYAFDRLGNLKSRHDRSGAGNLREEFEYDLLDRLERVLLSAPQHGLNLEETQAMAYDASGNIAFKSDVGGYSYGAGQAGPHAVTQAGGFTYSYDANGNQVWSSDGRSIEYSVFDKATRISRGGDSTEFFYGLGNARYKRVDNNAVDQQKTTLQVGNVELIEQGAAEPYFKRYIAGVAIVDYYPASQDSDAWYLTKDHLGSIHSISNADGYKVHESHIGPWGVRQHANWQSPLDTAGLITANAYTTRGFTGHEHADALGVIQMGGRIYDPRLGRFLQADPFVQAPKNGQSLNRYAYALNNPLSYTDPSGYFFKRLIRKWGRVIVAAVAAYVTWGLAYGWAATAVAAGANSSLAFAQFVSAVGWQTVSGIGAGAASGLVAGAILTGTLRGATKSAFAGAITGGINKYFGHTYNTRRIAAEGIAGGVNARIQGGRFEDGLKFALIVSGLNYANYRMDLAERAQSAKNSYNHNKPGSGLFGQEYSLTGARRLIDPDTGEFLPCRSAAGGCQGLPIIDGDQSSALLGVPFSPNSSVGYVTDAFAPAHDWLRNHFSRSYTASGNSKYFTGIRGVVDSLANYALVPVAAPFAVATLIITQPVVQLVTQTSIYAP